MSNIVEETVLDKNIKMCYTYDALGRVTQRTTVNLCDCCAASTETFSYDAAGNVTANGEQGVSYDTNNRLVSFNGNTVSYDLDGNMLQLGEKGFSYDSFNRLISADGHTYTYNAENVRIRNLCENEDTTYVYDTNCKLSKLLCKTTNGVTTKYVYGLGLIGEETNSNFLTYHFDFRGSTVAITDANGNITDTFAYDTYGKLTERTGSSDILFLYNGRDGVVTDKNGLIYMRARYYSPELRRFVNADIIPGSISKAVTLNRFSYANNNPVLFKDPTGYSAERGSLSIYENPLFIAKISPWGNPNTHVTHFDKYWIERWYGSDGRAVKDRHWSDHGYPKHHTIPHEQEWDWSNPNNPKLPSNSDPLSDIPSPPTTEGEEPWYPEDSKESSDEPTNNDNKHESDQVSSTGKIVSGIVIMAIAGATLIWLTANDATGVGAADDLAIAPVAAVFKQGMQMALGA